MQTETRSIHTFQEGEIFDNRYRLVKRAGSGGFADVWRVEDTLRKNKVVALKIYTRLDEEGIKAMSEEYNETEDIQHPNLLTGNHFAAVGNIPYMEMRYCDGGSLASRVGNMSNDELRHMLRDVCTGLSYLHAEGMVHQDIKPENILLDTKHNRYMLADFGISGKSRSRLSKSAKMASDLVAMTAAYAPPEKLSANRIDREPSTRGDIFSLGVTLYELATGNLPVDLPQSTGQLLLISQGRQPLDFDNIADPQLRQIAKRCMSYRKEDRPTAEEVLAMLDSRGTKPQFKHESTGNTGNTGGTGNAGNGKRPTERIKVNAEEPRKQKPPTVNIKNNSNHQKTELLKTWGRQSSKSSPHTSGLTKNGNIYSKVRKGVQSFFFQWRISRTLVEFITEIAACVSLILSILLYLLNDDWPWFVFYFFLICLWLYFVEKAIVHRKRLCKDLGGATVVIIYLILTNLAVCGSALLFVNEHLEWAQKYIVGISLALFFALFSTFGFKIKNYGGAVVLAILSLIGLISIFLD